MKKHIVKIALFTLCAAAIFGMPALSRAQDSTNTPAASGQTPKKHNTLPFKGNLASVDTNAMTIAVGSMTIQVSSKTKITKDGQPATLADGVVGQPVSGAYRKAEDGTMTATTIHFGAKGKKKKESTDTSGGQN